MLSQKLTFMNKFANKRFSVMAWDNTEIITGPGNVCEGIHAIRVPSNSEIRGVPLSLRAMDFDLLTIDKDAYQQPRPIDIQNTNINSIVMQLTDLNPRLYQQLRSRNVTIILLTTSQELMNVKDQRGNVITPSQWILSQTNNQMVDKIIIQLNSKITQLDLLDNLLGTTQDLAIVGLQQSIQDLSIESYDLIDTGYPDPVFQQSIDQLVNDFRITLIIQLQPQLAELRNHIIEGWQFERSTIEANVIVSDVTSRTFPTRVSNYDRYDQTLPTYIYTNSLLNLELLYNIYLLDEYISLYINMIEQIRSV